MRILFFGLENSIHINRTLSWFVDRGHFVSMISRASSTNIPGVHYYDIDKMVPKGILGRIFIRLNQSRFHNNYFYVITKFLAVRELFINKNFNIVFSYTVFNVFPGYLSLFSGFKPYVVMPLNGDLLWEVRSKSQGIIDRRQKWFVKFAVSRADFVTASSRQMYNAWLKHGAKPSKIKIIVDPGTDTEIFSPRPKDNDLIDQLNIKDNPVVLSTRTLGGLYNVDYIVKAIPKVLEKIPSTKFVFIWHSAEENQKEYLRTLAEKLEVENNIIFFGHLSSYSDVARFFSIADVFVSLSGYDTVPNSLLEAMASGVPPICADLPPLREWINDGHNGFIVPQQDSESTASKIIEILSDSDLAKKFSKINRNLVVEAADFKSQMLKLESIFNSLI